MPQCSPSLPQAAARQRASRADRARLPHTRGRAGSLRAAGNCIELEAASAEHPRLLKHRNLSAAAAPQGRREATPCERRWCGRNGAPFLPAPPSPTTVSTRLCETRCRRGRRPGGLRPSLLVHPSRNRILIICSEASRTCCLVSRDAPSACAQLLTVPLSRTKTL